MRLPGGTELPQPEQRRALASAGHRTRARAARGGRPRRGRRRSGGSRRGRLRGLRGARARWSSESTVLGGQAGASRRIENYLGFPAGISGSELTSRAITQARKFGARTATPYRALALEPGDDRHIVQLEEGHEIAARAIVLATGADYRRLPVGGLEDYEGISVFYAAGPPEAQRCGATRVGVVGGGNSAAQAAIWLARGGALVTLLHRRADLRETMSDYLHPELERYGVAVRDRSEIAELHGEDGELEAVTLQRRRAARVLATCSSSWARRRAPTGSATSSQRDEHGFVLTGSRRRRRRSARDERARASTRPATFARARSSAARRRSARARRSSASCTSGSTSVPA